jgi:hypothetical protein
MSQLQIELLRKSPEAWLCYMHGLYTPKSRSVTLSFDSGTPDGIPIRKTFDKTGSFVATRLAYTVRRPNYMTGSSAKRAADVAASQSPYVDVRFILDSNADGNQYILNTDFSPLENEGTFMQTSGQDDTWDRCWVLMYPDFLSVEGILKLTLADTEIPYEVTLTLKGMMLRGDNCFSEWSTSQMWDHIKTKFPDAYREARGEYAKP